jgi:hypothetical protein
MQATEKSTTKKVRIKIETGIEVEKLALYVKYNSSSTYSRPQ